ncbi:troponin C-like [Patiria miniata]|uniref:EF-hand domain-containing protein n=1 Tax=Patiria miniata TaxID=46514 RepID=A0A914A8U0_PATMI|nr:troponin C-like [Patiria miniata]
MGFTMGFAPSFPIKTQPTNFESVEAFDASGRRHEHYHQKKDVTQFESLTSKFFQRYVEERQNAQEAKAKFNDLVGLAARFPQWHESDIADFRTQFLSFDLNHDGLIDFPELDTALTELGDKSPYHVRKQKFDEIDVDHSDSIDFEEFLHLLDSVMMSSEGGISDAIGDMCKRETQNANTIRHLTLEQQMEAGLF